MAGGDRTWKVGELAEATGLTVRTLHHYEHVGLAEASARTAAGHRLYGEADLERLYRVLALRELGLSLEAIRSLMDGGPGLGALLDEQMVQTERRIEALQGLKARLSVVVTASRSGDLSADHLLGIIEGMADVNDSVRTYFDEEQIRVLEQRREEDPEKVGAQIAAWPGLIAEVGAAVENGADPASPEARDLARRWMELLEAFHGGDDAMRHSLYRMRAENSEEVQAQGGPDQAMIDFIARANEART